MYLVSSPLWGNHGPFNLVFLVYVKRQTNDVQNLKAIKDGRKKKDNISAVFVRHAMGDLKRLDWTYFNLHLVR